MWNFDDKKLVEEQIRFYHSLIESNGLEILPIREVKFTEDLSRMGFCEVHGQKEVTIGVSDVAVAMGSEFLREIILKQLVYALKECAPYYKVTRSTSWFNGADKVSKLLGVEINKSTYKYKSRLKAITDMRKPWVVTCKCCGATYRYAKKTRLVKAVLEGDTDSWTCKCGQSGKFEVFRIEV